MTAGARTGEARLFVALDLPRDVRAAIGWWGREARRESGPMRLVDADLLHVTVAFLGSRPVAEIDALAAVTLAAATPVEQLAIGAPLWLPRRRPRLLAVEVHDDHGALGGLYDALVAALAEEIDWAPEHRAFHPHITVARMRAGSAPRARALPATPAAVFSGEALTLYRSWLSPAGASYEPLARAGLGGEGAAGAG